MALGQWTVQWERCTTLTLPQNASDRECVCFSYHVSLPSISISFFPFAGRPSLNPHSFVLQTNVQCTPWYYVKESSFPDTPHQNRPPHAPLSILPPSFFLHQPTLLDSPFALSSLALMHPFRRILVVSPPSPPLTCFPV